MKTVSTHTEWEVQTTEPDGSWRTWTDGLTRQAAIDEMRDCIARGLKWNKHMRRNQVKWRIECREVETSYIYPESLE